METGIGIVIERWGKRCADHDDDQDEPDWSLSGRPDYEESAETGYISFSDTDKLIFGQKKNKRQPQLDKGPLAPVCWR